MMLSNLSQSCAERASVGMSDALTIGLSADRSGERADRVVTESPYPALTETIRESVRSRVPLLLDVLKDKGQESRVRESAAGKPTLGHEVKDAYKAVPSLGLSLRCCEPHYRIESKDSGKIP